MCSAAKSRNSPITKMLQTILLPSLLLLVYQVKKSLNSWSAACLLVACFKRACIWCSILYGAITAAVVLWGVILIHAFHHGAIFPSDNSQRGFPSAIFWGVFVHLSSSQQRCYYRVDLMARVLTSHYIVYIHTSVQLGELWTVLNASLIQQYALLR